MGKDTKGIIVRHIQGIAYGGKWSWYRIQAGEER